MRFILSLCLLLFSFLFFQFTQQKNTLNFFNPSSAYAATYTISGTTGVSGGQFGTDNILILLNGPTSGSRTTGGSGGSFSFTNLPAGTYLVQVQNTDYDVVGGRQRSVVVGPNKSVDFVVYPIFNVTGAVTNSSTGAGVGSIPVTINALYGTLSTTTASDGTYTLSYYLNCPTTASITVPSGYVATTPTSQVIGCGASANVNFGIAQYNTISGTVYKDANQNGKLDTGEAGYQGISVSITNTSGTSTTTTDANGNYSFQVSPTAGNSTVKVTTVPAGWYATTATSQTVASTVNTTGLNFGLGQDNTISGNAFVDLNKNGIEDNGEINYAAAPPITISPPGGTVTANANGSYTITNLTPGTYSVIYGTPPTGYYMTSPLTGPPNAFSVTVGDTGCTVNGAPGATCTTGNITNLNFGISNTFPWFQSTCGDMRNDNGIVDNLPAGISAIVATSPCTTPGILFTGNANASLGKGTASSTNQVVGGATYPEVYPSSYSPLSTSYPSLVSKAANAGITPIDVTTSPISCSLNSCTLPTTITHGIYIANGNMTLNTFTAPANQNFIFLVNGNLTVNGPITVPVGSTVLFSVNGNITVSPTVGATPATTTSTLAGWYVAGGSFILPSAGNCADTRLNIAGTVVVNALGTGGTFQNNRDLCGSDTADPTVSFIQRLDMILNAPQFLEQQVTLSQEVSP